MNRFKNKINKCNVLFLALVTICLVFIVVHWFILIEHSDNRLIRYADNYSVVDLANAKMINLGVKSPTFEDYQKYDIDLDGDITHNDIQIIHHMLLGYYDIYEIKNGEKRVIKYTDI